jgi:hypothetical protein
VVPQVVEDGRRSADTRRTTDIEDFAATLRFTGKNRRHLSQDVFSRPALDRMVGANRHFSDPWNFILPVIILVPPSLF